MIDLTPLDVRKKKGDFRRRVRGYDVQLVDDFLDLVAERLEELVKQNVALSERAHQLQEQVAQFRERERALNEALVAAQELREQARSQAEREAELVRREAEASAERILEEGQRALREVKRQLETLESRKASFLRAFRSLLERYAAELEVEGTRLAEESGSSVVAPRPARAPAGSEPETGAGSPGGGSGGKPVPSRGSLDATVRPRKSGGRPAGPAERGETPPAPGTPAAPRGEGAAPAGPAAVGSEDWLSAIFQEGEENE